MMMKKEGILFYFYEFIIHYSPAQSTDLPLTRTTARDKKGTGKKETRSALCLAPGERNFPPSPRE